MIGNMLVIEVKHNGRHACVSQFPDKSYVWWPYAEQGFPEKSLISARDAAVKYIKTGIVPKKETDSKPR